MTGPDLRDPRVKAIMANVRFYKDVFDALFLRALKGQVTPDATERLREVGLDLTLGLKESYPIGTWLAAIRIGAKLHAPTLPEHEALWSLGEAFIDSYRSTLSGRALMAMLRLLGPDRAMKQMTTNFRSGISQTETRLKRVGEGDWQLWISNALGPARFITGGMMKRGLEAAGAHNVRIHISAHDGVETTYRVTWSTE